MIGIISGSGFYDFPSIEKPVEKIVETPFGKASVTIGNVFGKEVAFIARHGKKHEFLSNMINYRANIWALKEAGVKCIISTSVCGIINPDMQLAKPILFDDLYFLDNRLPNGEICSMYTTSGAKERGHYIFSSPFNQSVIKALMSQNPDAVTKATYAHVNGPRFNSKAEIKMLQQHADAISQTAGPEIILAGELEIPIALIGFGVDYANGVKETPTPIDVLNNNLKLSKEKLTQIIVEYIRDIKDVQFDGFVYRFA